MQWKVVRSSGPPRDSELLVLAVAEKDGAPEPEALARAGARAGEDLAVAGRPGAFSARPEAWLLLPRQRRGWLLLVGVGPAAELSAERLRRAAGTAAAQARRLRAEGLAWLLPESGPDWDAAALARCLVEGTELALSPTGSRKTAAGRRAGEGGGRADDLPRAGRLVAGTDAAAARRGATEGEAYAAGCLLARRLADAPANLLTPRALAAEARALARREGLRCTVLGPAELRRRRCGGILGVGAGSAQPPALIMLESRADRPRGAPLVGLVGKGVTFDAGGISLKPSPKMDQMKMDMAGAAAVLGAALTIRRLDLPVRLLAVLPAAENLPDGKALKPGDVITMASGRTVEVLNTDAEGRLLLADALHLASRRRPRWLLDIATLTGSCAMALGEQFAGVLGTDGDLIDTLRRAGGETFERVWPLPLIEEHHKAIESQIADLKNLGPREAGALTAAAFLAEFVDEDVAWAHLDIAGPAWTTSAGPLGPKGATGFGARLLARTVQILVS